jgi:hypothetical protein
MCSFPIKVHAVLVWAGMTLGGEGFLSPSLASHFPPGSRHLLGLKINPFIFLGPAEETIVGRFGLEWTRRFLLWGQLGCSSVPGSLAGAR